MPFVFLCNSLQCLEVCVCNALKSSTLTTVKAWVSAYLTVHPFMSAFVSRHLSLSQGVSIFLCFPLRALSVPLPASACVCVSSPVAVSSGPHNPRERVVSFFTLTGTAHAGWPQVSRLIVSGQHLSVLCLRLRFQRPPTTVPAGAKTEKWPWQRLCLFETDWRGSYSQFG